MCHSLRTPSASRCSSRGASQTLVQKATRNIPPCFLSVRGKSDIPLLLLVFFFELVVSFDLLNLIFHVNFLCHLVGHTLQPRVGGNNSCLSLSFLSSAACVTCCKACRAQGTHHLHQPCLQGSDDVTPMLVLVMHRSLVFQRFSRLCFIKR